MNSPGNVFSKKGQTAERKSAWKEQAWFSGKNIEGGQDYYIVLEFRWLGHNK